MSVLIDASKCHVVRIKSNALKHWWNDKLSDLKQQSCDAHNIWLLNCKPNSGSCFEHMKKAKMNYKLYLRQCRKDENSMLTDKLYSNLAQHDSKSFWKIWNKNF